MKKFFSSTTFLIIGLIVVAALTRVARDFGWLPLPPNVAPITAMALFSGALLPRRMAFVLPLAAMLASDMVIGFYSLPVMLAVYGSFAISNLIGLRLRQRRTAGRIVGYSLVGSTLFFLITNAAVWAFQAMYPHTGAGLFQAYVAGLPFFRNTVLGDLGYTAVLFGSYAAVVLYLRRSLVPQTDV